jgi:16S rRNA (cytosine967-C5)-methyltransferase
MPPLDKPREQALAILRRAEDGVFAGALLEQARPSFSPLDNAFILELVYGTLRNRERIDWALDQFSKKPVRKTDPWTRNILRLGAYQLLFLDRVPASAAVNTSTELAKHHGKKPGYANGLLRNLERNRNAVAWPGPADPVKHLSVLYSHPAWLVRRWVERFGVEAAEALLASNNQPAPLTVRTNTLKTTREELKASLESQGVWTRETAFSPAGLEIVSSHAGITTLQAFQDGWFMVQDQAAQLVGMLLAPKPGETVLDACAAPGGKATHLAEMMKDEGTVVALESDPRRIERIRDNSRRLRTTIILPVVGDATTFREGTYDKILIDAPCSGLGVLRRHPDGRWTKSEKTIREKQALQRKILENCSRLLKPGGALVYATCTTEPEENEEVINAFLAGHPEFALDDPRPHLPASAGKLVDDKGFFRTFPAELEMDGFFGARMVKKG